MGIPPEALELLTILAPKGLDILRKRLAAPHGSKVKDGAYKDCTIELDENDEYAFIVVDPGRGSVLYLTSDTIQAYQYVKQDKKLHKGKLKTYYYYNITFKDGSASYVRMRKKYCNAMFNHM